MGTINSVQIENALYGFKTDLLDQLRDGNVPRWIHNTHRGGDTDAQDYFEREQERAKQRDHGGIASLKIYASERDKYGIGSSRERRPPERIRERLQEYLDSQKHEQEQRYLRPGEFFDGFRINIRFGPRGGVTDVDVTAEYRD